MVELRVNNVSVSVAAGSTVLQACDKVGVEVPRFCYHERLGIAGNCRRCLVEIDKSPKPVASCARPVRANRVVYTDTPQVKKAREAVLEFLLLNHPLDCPICDQGGECDLQDQSRVFGSDRSRYRTGSKRAVADKDWGPLVKTVMTRCIQCTRCVRFASEVAGVSDLGATGRGRQVEIGTYAPKPFLSELSGNVVELCPVGALTAQGAAGPFTFRSWEVVSTDTIDVTDPLLGAVRVQTKGSRVRRVLSREDAATNGCWLSDKGRYAPVDGTLTQRIARPMASVNGLWSALSSDDADALLASTVASASSVHVLFGSAIDRSTAESVWSRVVSYGSGKSVNAWSLASAPADGVRLGNWSAADVESADGVLLVHCDLRKVSPVFNSRLRRVFLDGTEVGSWGATVDATFPVQHVGRTMGPESWTSVDEWLSTFKNPLIRVGARAPLPSSMRLWNNRSVVYVPVRANERSYASLNVWPRRPSFGAGSVAIAVGVTESEAASVGLRLTTDVLSAASSWIVYGYSGASWMTQRSVRRVLPLTNPLEASLTYVNRFGQRRSTTPVWSTSSQPMAEAPSLWATGSSAQRRWPMGRGAVPVPAIVDQHVEGHPFAEQSPTMARVSALWNVYGSNFVSY